MKKCYKCLLPETYETIEFSNASCNICLGSEHKNEHIDWEAREKSLKDLIEKYRGKYDYDCIVPFSGGKDSTFTLYYLVKNYNVKPLVVRFNHGFMRPVVQENCTNTLKKLGVDFIDFTPNWHVVKLLMKESFNRKSDFCWHCHTGIFTYPIRLSVKLNIPLIFWGETQSEITAYYNYQDNKIEFEDEEKMNKMRNLGITAEDMYEMLKENNKNLDRRDLFPYTYPDQGEIKKNGCYSVALGNFIKWDYDKNTKEIIKNLNWKVVETEGVPKEINIYGEKTECFMQGTRDYIKFLKRGYGRTTQINAFNLRNKKKTAQQCKEENINFDGKKPHSLEIFLEYMGITEDEFKEIISKMTVYPNHPNFDSNDYSKKLDDFELWYRENNKS